MTIPGNPSDTHDSGAGGPQPPLPAAPPESRPPSRTHEPHRHERRRLFWLLVTAGVVAVAVLVLVGLARPSGAPPFTGKVSAPGGGRSWRVTAWSRGAAAPLDVALKDHAVDEVDFDWYISQPNGTVRAPHEDLALVKRVRAAGVQALATVTNFGSGSFSGDVATAILASPDSRRRHVAALVDLAVQKGYDGIDMDWEMIKPADRDHFSEFVEELGTALHLQHRLLSIAVFPKTSEPGEWDTQKPYDYRRLGNAVDEFKIMTYSFSGSWSKPGPQTPLAWAGQVLSFAEGQVDAGKIYMGVPFYGFDWHTDAGGATSTAAVHSDDAAALIARYGAKVTRDAASNEAVFTYTDPSGVAHTVYFQDQAAIAAKLALLKRAHPRIAGIAVWEALDEDPLFWQVISRGLRKKGS